MMKTFSILLFFAFSNIINAQDYKYLDDIKLKKKADFDNNVDNLKKAVDYLFSSEADDSDVDRLYCQKFVIVYADKAPITITLDASIANVIEENSSLLVMYIGELLVSKIDNPKESSDAHQLQAYKRIYEYCKAGNNIKETDTILSLIEAGDNDDLETWMKKLANGE